MRECDLTRTSSLIRHRECRRLEQRILKNRHKIIVRFLLSTTTPRDFNIRKEKRTVIIVKSY